MSTAGMATRLVPLDGGGQHGPWGGVDVALEGVEAPSLDALLGHRCKGERLLQPYRLGFGESNGCNCLDGSQTIEDVEAKEFRPNLAQT